MRLILASSSPRRKDLLEKAGYGFEIITKAVDEEKYITNTETPEEIVKKISHIKGKMVFEETKGNIMVISADTIVVLNGKIIGKPKDEKDAYHILNSLQNSSHEVITCVSFFKREDGKEEFASISDTSTVHMGAMTGEEIKNYIKTKEPMDKAGAYGIQGLGGLFVKEIKGDFYNIEGLPLRLVYLKLKEMANIAPKFQIQ